MELAVAMDRIDRLERMVAERTGIELSELRAIDYTEGVADQERRRRFGFEIASNRAVTPPATSVLHPASAASRE
jgi:hypothetical protein